MIIIKQHKFEAYPLCTIAFLAQFFYKSQMMKIIRLYTGHDGESHFEEIEMEFKPMGDAETTSLQAAAGIVFRRAPAGHILDWHPAPRRQYVMTLSGQGEIEIGDGMVRRFGPGDVLLAEDVTGRGHITRVVGSQPRVYVTVPLK